MDGIAGVGATALAGPEEGASLARTAPYFNALARAAATINWVIELEVVTTDSDAES
ncbi:MAG: hypothetical protein K0R61_4699 [Microvirga sp.]|jgi:hypothetical protein|nr:hypothetical protein [Microvirga sp.]